MNRRYNCSAIVRNVSEDLSHEEGGGAVKAASGLVKKQEMGPCKDFECNTESLLLPTTYASQMPVPDEVISTILKSHFT
ncbi:unnamed protein product [Camellia sinensis]